MLRDTFKAVVLAAALSLAAGCTGGAGWEYRVEWISPLEAGQATVYEYLRLQGKTLGQVQVMKGAELQKAHGEMAAAMGKDVELAAKLQQFVLNVYLAARINFRAAEGWQLHQLQIQGNQGEMMVLVYKRRGRPRMPPPEPSLPLPEK